MPGARSSTTPGDRADVGHRTHLFGREAPGAAPTVRRPDHCWKGWRNVSGSSQMGLRQHAG